MSLFHDVELSTGRVVKHRPMPNGATEAYGTPDPEELTPGEWEEYVNHHAHHARTERGDAS